MGKRKLVPCSKCGKEKRKSKTGLCSKCYQTRVIEKKRLECKKCGAPRSYGSKSGLCDECFRRKRNEEYIDSWIRNNGKKLKGRPRGKIREYVLNRQDGVCDICKRDPVWNDKELVFVLDHVDGDHINNSPTNLRMICPNCDSQLPTFKNKNRGNGRAYDRQYRIKKYREGCTNGR